MWHLVQGLPGEQLVQELVARNGMDEAAARSWIEQQTGRRYDSHRRYRLRLPSDPAGGERRPASRGKKPPPHEVWGLERP